MNTIMSAPDISITSYYCQPHINHSEESRLGNGDAHIGTYGSLTKNSRARHSGLFPTMRRTRSSGCNLSNMVTTSSLAYWICSSLSNSLQQIIDPFQMPSDRSIPPEGNDEKEVQRSLAFPKRISFDNHPPLDKSSPQPPISDEFKSIMSDTSKKYERRWDLFWRQLIHTNGKGVRRHIIMVSVMKQCMQAVHTEAAQDNKITELIRIYRKTIANRYGLAPNDLPNDIDQLETLAFYLMQNARSNIFIGNKNWNSAISDVAQKIKGAETNFTHKIMATRTPQILDSRTETWCHQNIELQRSYKCREYHSIREGLRDDITHIVGSKRTRSDQPVESMKSRKISIVKSLYDSLVTDLSQASDQSMRLWQNQHLPRIQGEMLTLIDYPVLDEFQSTLTKFFDLDIQAAKALNFDLAQLSEGGDNTAIAAFQQKITAPD